MTDAAAAPAVPAGYAEVPAAGAEVVLDDDRVRVTVWRFGAGGAATGHHVHEHDYVVVPVTGGRFVVTVADGTVRNMTQTAAHPYVGVAGTAHDVVSTAGTPAVFVEVELKLPSSR